MKQPKCIFLSSGGRGDFNNLLSGRHRRGREPRRPTRGTVDRNRSERWGGRTTRHPEGGAFARPPAASDSGHTAPVSSDNWQEVAKRAGEMKTGRARKTTRGGKKKKRAAVTWSQLNFAAGLSWHRRCWVHLKPAADWLAAPLHNQIM